MSNKQFNLWLIIARLVPKKLVYACAVLVAAYATYGKNEKNNLSKLKATDAIRIYGDGNGI